MRKERPADANGETRIEVHPKPFLGRAIQLQKHVAKRLTVERMTREILDFYISALGDVPAAKPVPAKSAS